jgi:hypothetical protein
MIKAGASVAYAAPCLRSPRDQTPLSPASYLTQTRGFSYSPRVTDKREAQSGFSRLDGAPSENDVRLNAPPHCDSVGPS